MKDFICPHCGSFMEYAACDGSFICGTCRYIIMDDGSGNFSAMDSETAINPGLQQCTGSKKMMLTEHDREIKRRDAIMPDAKMKVSEIRNNLFDTNEILWLLEGHEDMSAFEFVCKYIVEVEPGNISDVLE